MQYVKLKEQLKDMTIFSLRDIKRLDARFHRRRLSEWQKKGYLIKVVKGYYIFSDLRLTESGLYEIANRIYSPSYVSFQTALAHYGLIPESVYGITSASSRRTYLFKTRMADFIYRAIKPRLFFGYDIRQYEGKAFKIATPEKALLDLFYIVTSIKSAEDFETLRINKDDFFKVINRQRLFEYLKRFRQKALKKRISSFLNFLKYA